MYDFYQLRVDECDKQIEQALAVLNAGKPEPNQTDTKTRQRTKQANAVNFDVAFSPLSVGWHRFNADPWYWAVFGITPDRRMRH